MQTSMSASFDLAPLSEKSGLDQALAAVRDGDTLVVPKFYRLARSVPDARAIAEQLEKKGVRLALGASVYDPTDPMGKMFFNILATLGSSWVECRIGR